MSEKACFSQLKNSFSKPPGVDCLYGIFLLAVESRMDTRDKGMQTQNV